MKGAHGVKENGLFEDFRNRYLLSENLFLEGHVRAGCCVQPPLTNGPNIWPCSGRRNGMFVKFRMCIPWVAAQ